MIIGCCGSGKSTLAKKLFEISGIPLFHLDQYYWKPNWTETPTEEWESIVGDLASQDRWIIDGNYGGTMDIRFKYADMVVYMDYSTLKCLGRVIRRTIKHHGQARPDMTQGCPERFDFDFLHYVATFNILRRKSTLKKLRTLKNEKRIVRIKNKKDEKAFLEDFNSFFTLDNQF